jgi:hypothetical protein
MAVIKPYQTEIEVGVRLTGTLAEVDLAVSHLRTLGRVKRISKALPYDNNREGRTDWVRVYVTIELPVEVRGAERK